MAIDFIQSEIDTIKKHIDGRWPITFAFILLSKIVIHASAFRYQKSFDQ
jgi:hypothetical protein